MDGRMVRLRPMVTMHAAVRGLATLALLTACLSGCARRAPAATDAPPECSGRAPRGARMFTLADVDSIIGTFELTQITRTPPAGRVVRGRLELWRQDSSRVLRFAAGPIPEALRRRHPERGRYLAGAFDAKPTDTSPWGERLRSRDPARPGVILESGHLRMGEVDILDGAGEDLEILWVTADGFGGRWQSDLGNGTLVDAAGRPLPDPAGVFCARRVAD